MKGNRTYSAIATGAAEEVAKMVMTEKKVASCILNVDDESDWS